MREKGNKDKFHELLGRTLSSSLRKKYKLLWIGPKRRFAKVRFLLGDGGRLMGIVS